MASPLDSTFGFWLVVIWLQTLLQGCGILQSWLYFHWYPSDHWGVKTMVAILLILETFQIIDFFQITYFYFIDGFGDLRGLFLIHWQDSAQLCATYLCGFIVQMYFGYCVYALNKKNRMLPIIIIFLALTQMAFGIATTAIGIKLISFVELDKIKVLTALQASFTLLCDVMITCSLVYCLSKRKKQIKLPNHIVTKLALFAINRGVLTAVCALLNLILFLAEPGTFYFFIGLELSGKLYLNSALATLNSRQHIDNMVHTTRDTNWNPSINFQMNPMSVMTSNPSVGEENQVDIMIKKRIEADHSV